MAARALWALVLLAGLSAARAGEVATPAPGPRDLCPVCGMVVSKYPPWVATVLWRDGHARHFDGAKDLFKYLRELPRYAPGHRPEDIAVIAVTDYYELRRIDARQAFYVIGSDVRGPMGHELVPLATREEADEFLHDHRGRRILTFKEVTHELLQSLDRGRFD